MHLEYYTADAICQAMGLPEFVEESWTQRDGPTLRLLLKPSCHPELCLTLFREKESTRLSVVALAESFWTQVATAQVVHTLTEDEARRRVESEEGRRAGEEARRRVEYEARRKAEEEARRRYKSEGRRVEEEVLRIEEEARRRYKSEGRRVEEEVLRIEEEARRRVEEEARRKAEKEARRFYESEEARRRFASEGGWIKLTEEQKAASVRAMKRAIKAHWRFESKDECGAEEEVRRRFESEEGRWVEEEVHRIEEEARQRCESEDVRWIEEEAHEATTRPKKAQRLLPSEREQVLLPSSAFDEVAKLFSEARAAFDLARWTFLDGMGSESCLVSRAGVHRFDARVSGVAMVAYVGKVITLAWSSCRRPRVRKALAEAAGYIDMNTDHTLKEVGQQYSAARERSRQIEAKTLRKLKANALRKLKHLRTRRS